MKTFCHIQHFHVLRDAFRKLLCPPLPLFGSLLVIQLIQFVISLCFVEHAGIGLLIGAIAWAYVMSLPLNLSGSKIWHGVYSAFVLTINGLLVLLALFCAVKLKELIGITHIEVLANTNYNESVEFLSSFVDWYYISMSFAITLLAVFVYQIMRKVRSTKVSAILMLVSICSTIFTMYFGIWSDCGIGRVIHSILEYKKNISFNLKESQPDFAVCEISRIHPNIILVIGESFDKYHSSLYGYEKNTNPRLSERVKDSTLIVFSSVESAAPNTNMLLRQMLSLSERYDDDTWYNKPMLTSALKKGGYNTFWLSNQCASSIFDRSFSELAHLCDSVRYTTDQYTDHNQNVKIYDDVLFIPFKEYVNQIGGSDRNFCVIHLMGSHYRYDFRYPSIFAKYMVSDYPDQPESRRETFATYDNSILYNDYVVDSLMEIANDFESFVIYAPDHGQDFYYTRDMAGHGGVEDAISFKAGCKIPFLIFFSKTFKEKYPEIVQLTFSLSSKEFNTKYLMNTIMEMAGYDISGYSVLEHSLFEGDLYRDSIL